MTLPVVIFFVMAGLFILGEMIPSYPASTKTPSVPSTDLRVSEFAPDLDAVPSAEQQEFTALQRARKIHSDQEKERQDKLRESQRRQDESLKIIYQDYASKITEIKLRRMKEGNPVTKKNPIDPDEMPPKPYNHL